MRNSQGTARAQQPLERTTPEDLRWSNSSKLYRVVHFDLQLVALAKTQQQRPIVQVHFTNGARGVCDEISLDSNAHAQFERTAFNDSRFD